MSENESLDPAGVRRLAILANQRTWELIQSTEAGDPNAGWEAVTSACASLHLWSRVGTALHRARGHWLVSRCFARLSQAEPAKIHAQKCMEWTEQADDAKDFDRAYAIEALARAEACLGNELEATRLKMQAVAAIASVADPEDRSIYQSDVLGEPWFGI